jgi:VIT1/CCC1 family predicted Fe2+/Mn2+ transporter
MSGGDAARITLWLENLRDERDGVALYRGLAGVERDAQRAQEFAALAEAEERHVAIWRRKLDKAGIPLPPDRASPRVRFLVWMAGRLGTQAVLPLVVLAESSDVAKYARQGRESAALVAEEQEHGATLRRLSGAKPQTPQALIGERERWHRVGRGGTLRAGVFGANDGLVSNLSLVLGVAAAGAQRGTLLVTGLAGLFAGALSMAVGEYVSVASQRDMLRRQIVLEGRELAEAPEEEEAELAQLLREKGLSEAQAEETARQIMQNPDSALDTLVREELGLDPGDLGSPTRAALSSFLTFAMGAALPLVPLLFLTGRSAAVAAAAVGAVVLAGIGGLLGFLAGTSPLRSAVRMVALAAVAAAVTVGVGRVVGASLG